MQRYVGSLLDILPLESSSNVSKRSNSFVRFWYSGDSDVLTLLFRNTVVTQALDLRPLVAENSVPIHDDLLLRRECRGTVNE
jgi:hypothetical protein